MTITTIGLDADDTLWHNGRFFELTQARFTALLADHADGACWPQSGAIWAITGSASKVSCCR